jgi:CHASE3 domain sensor protein
MASGDFVNKLNQAVSIIQPLVQDLQATFDALNQVKSASIWSIEAQLDQAETELGKAVQIAYQINQQVQKTISEALEEQKTYNMYGFLGGLAAGVLLSLIIRKR